jgi:hypothetical protein
MIVPEVTLEQSNDFHQPILADNILRHRLDFGILGAVEIDKPSAPLYSRPDPGLSFIADH